MSAGDAGTGRCSRSRVAVWAIVFSAAIVVSQSPAVAAGVGKIRSVAIQLLDDLGITTGGVYTGSSASHTLLNSLNVTDTTTGTVARGDVVTGQGASATWTRLAKGTADQVLSMDATGTDVVWADASGGGFTIGLPVSSGVASVSSTTYPAFTTNTTSGVPHLAFDGATQEAIQWHGVTLPDAYDSSSNVTFEAVISSGSTSQAVRFGLRVATVEGAAIGTAPGTLLDTQQVVDATTSGTANTATTITWTLANGAIDAASAGDLLMIQLDRDAASAEDSSTVDVFVHTLRIYQ